MEASLPGRETAIARFAGGIERPLIRVLEYVAAALVLGDVGILLVGVIARYIFQTPLIETDDLAQAVFLWLGMIGSVIALNRGEHMRMTALLARARPRTRVGMEVYGAAVGLMFLAAVVQPAIEYVEEVARLTMPGMQVSKAWLTAPLPVGFTLMIVIAAARLFRSFPAWVGVLLLALAGFVAWGVPLMDPYMERLGNINLIVFFVGVVGASVLC